MKKEYQPINMEVCYFQLTDFLSASSGSTTLPFDIGGESKEDGTYFDNL